MTYTEATEKIREIKRAISKVKHHIIAQPYYNNTQWFNIIKTLKKEKERIEELIHKGELDEKEVKSKPISDTYAKEWGIEIIKL